MLLGGARGKWEMLAATKPVVSPSMYNNGLYGLFRLLRFELSFAAGTCVLLAEVLFDVVVFHSVSRLLNPGIPDRIADIRRIYLGGTAMILVLTVMRLAID